MSDFFPGDDILQIWHHILVTIWHKIRTNFFLNLTLMYPGILYVLWIKMEQGLSCSRFFIISKLYENL